jgi:protein translocase SecG subunit
MNALTIILAVLDIIVCVVLLVLVAIQDIGNGGLGSLAGDVDSFLDRTGGGTKEEKLKKLTSIMAVSFAILSVVLYLLTGRA